MHIARICRAKYPGLDGAGAALAGGRWNSPGTHVVYTSSCGALAVLEYRVNTLEDPRDLLLYTIEIPDSLTIERVNWTPDFRTGRSFGDLAGAIAIIGKQTFMLDQRLFDLTR